MRTISVTGTGAASAAPDTVTLTLGVRVQANDAATALEVAAAKQQSLVDALTAGGHHGADLQSDSLSCRPLTDHRGERITGFEVMSTLRVQSRDVAGAGALVDTAVRAAGDDTVVHGLTFAVRDPAPLAALARDAAYDDAVRIAEQFAARAGVTLGDVQSIDAAVPAGGPPVPMLRMAAADSAMPVEGGEVTVREAVTVIFAIAD